MGMEHFANRHHEFAARRKATRAVEAVMSLADILATDQGIGALEPNITTRRAALHHIRQELTDPTHHVAAGWWVAVGCMAAMQAGKRSGTAADVVDYRTSRQLIIDGIDGRIATIDSEAVDADGNADPFAGLVD